MQLSEPSSFAGKKQQTMHKFEMNGKYKIFIKIYTIKS